MDQSPSPVDRVLHFALDNRLVVALLVTVAIAWGVLVAPFDWKIEGIPRDPVPVDAIPDTGDNQQIVFTKWAGRSPQDVEDQVTYPLTVALLGVPGVKTIRSSSMLGFSSIFVIFKEDVEFYWSRSRILEKLASLSSANLPDGVNPVLGPDATGLGQVYWYTLEGRSEEGEPTGGWDLEELRRAQDWQVRYALMGVDGVAEVASIGGYQKEYQVDVDPDAMRAYGVTITDIFKAIRDSNVDVGARTLELNAVEYVIRGIGFIKRLEDLEQAVVKVVDNVPITVHQVATVGFGPALRRGALDKGGAEAVGGVVVVRYGANPLAVIERVKAKLREIAPGMPSKTLADGTLSRISVEPFYDRSDLILETLDTLNSALEHEILATILVVLVMLAHFRSAMLVAGLLPMAVLLCFIAMKYFGIDANVVALSGIAIAIGTMVDMGVVLSENILRNVDVDSSSEERKKAVFKASSEVGSAVLTAVLTTVVSFLPVFTMEGAEGKLFKPLAYTKTFALLASVVVALVVIPPLAHVLFRSWRAGGAEKTALPLPGRARRLVGPVFNWAVIVVIAILLARVWNPLGLDRDSVNTVFVAGLLGSVLGGFWLFQLRYEAMLRWCLDHKLAFLSLPASIVVFGLVVWLGFGTVFGFVPMALRSGSMASAWSVAEHTFPGLGKEFMPPLDEGSFLLMPVTMPHASIGESYDVIRRQDMLIRSIPEVETVVGKIGRIESPLDPAPVSMVETIIQYKSEYRRDANGRVARFAFDTETRDFVRDDGGKLVADDAGRPFRQWRPQIRKPMDIWDEIAKAAVLTGVTGASMLQPIETRRIMLQTGMRTPMGLKIQGPDLATIEAFGLKLEGLLKRTPGVDPGSVIADRIVGKPYLEIDIDREAIARYGLSIADVQHVIETAIGGRTVTSTVEGRERYPVRVRYARELRDQIETLGEILVPTVGGAQIPIDQLAEIRYSPGPQNIKSEDTFLTGYVLFDKLVGQAEVDVVEACQRFLSEETEAGRLAIPEGVSYRFTGNYENQVRSEQRLRLVLPLALFVIFLILYFQFRRVSTTLIVFTGVFVAWAGGFIMIWLYGQDWFLAFDLFDVSMRELFHVHAMNLSVAVWVGFLALFGIATDDGVILATYLDQEFARAEPQTREDIRAAVVEAGKRRIRPCLMTSATTLLALIPVLTSSGRGSDVMVPMAIPSFGGMAVVLITVFVVPTIYCGLRELGLRRAA